MPDVPDLVFALSPAAAYRADVATRQGAFGPHDDEWLVAASAVHLAATSSDASRLRQLSVAIDAAMQALGGERIDRFAEREWLGERMAVEAVVVLCDVIEEAGALHLAGVMLDDLVHVTKDHSPLQRGRILAYRARIDRKLGRFDEAAERYNCVAHLARDSESLELQARREIGLAALAQVKGNLPALHEHSQRAAMLARAIGHRHLEFLAQQGLTVVASKTNRYEDALVAGWKVVELAKGDPIREAEALQNMGQLMLEAGRLKAARASFAAVMTRLGSTRTMLSALGGLALVSARLGMEASVEWSIREVWRARDLLAPTYELAEALLESASALLEMQRHDEAERYRKASLEIAHRAGFHELSFRAEHLQPGAPRIAEPGPLVGESAAVERDLMFLEPNELPPQLEFQAAPG